MVGDPDVRQVRAGERRKSGGGNTNLFEKRRKVLGASFHLQGLMALLLSMF